MVVSLVSEQEVRRRGVNGSAFGNADEKVKRGRWRDGAAHAHGFVQLGELSSGPHWKASVAPGIKETLDSS